MGDDTKPLVFIVESLGLEDEKEARSEGQVLQRILRMSGKETTYFYIRTRKELEKFAKTFGASRYRYLHLSCHANKTLMATTLDRISFADLGDILRPHLGKRRVFLSACEMGTKELALALLKDSGCYSVIGPAEAVEFGDAALLWSSFYHLMFKRNHAAMQRKWITAHLQDTANLFQVSMNYFSLGAKGKLLHKAIEPKNNQAP
ncbi:MAG: hypothetical protein K1Y01_12675 [Vicinamibacteria bacterium]|nr:hypothetical protein [Vicinamibacteria bacterium]